ncbi:protein D3-like [Anoplophora glabripennis]|uniref:protein D3-like n=1 Tax=Anoplophora glabripennis TaxID=217634 RepID=UPI000C77FEA2|nr:protein D3-like [Anoplophora glabripennis]XP_023310345.1 protein D3-like [Anoplophora glabripennis]
METHGIVPDTIDEAPSAKITKKYPGGVEVEFGGELTPTQVKDEPEVKWDANPEKYYVLSMVDPDAPTRMDPKFREVNHWLIGNIKGSDVSTGNVIADYRGSGPPKGTGLHRYIFLVHEQKEKLTFDEPRSPQMSREHRFNFSIRKFAKKYNLGKAYAGNFYVAQWDPYVDEKKKQGANK